MNELDVCLKEKPLQQNISINTNSLIEMSTVQTLVNVDVTYFKKYSKIQGLISLKGWHSMCPKNHQTPSSFEIFFEIPKTPANVSAVDICVNLRGPSEYLPIFSEPNCLVSSIPSQIEDDLPIGYLNTTRKAKYDDQFCLGQRFTKMSFYPQKNDLIANSLGNNEKSLIFVHLLWTSCILIFIIIVILIYGILHGDNSKFDKYIEKCTNLIQHR
ncbi:unnamed protein product [Phaedon cochleariae]|nr:unnamed protein product [Phaedon cochleariae]